MKASMRSPESRRRYVTWILNAVEPCGPKSMAAGAYVTAAVVFLLATLASPARAAEHELALVRLKYEVDHSTRSTDWNAKAFARVLCNISEALNRATSVKTAEDPNVLTLENPDIFCHPFLFMAGHYGPVLNEKEVANLRGHLTRGGFLLATSCCGNASFTSAFEREMKKVLPDKELKPLPPDHPVFHVFYTIEQVRSFSGSNEASAKVEPPQLRGIDIEGRTAVIFSPQALTCGWTRRPTCIATCKRYATEDAFRIGINVIIHALTH